ncbi:hypothetical protein R5E07_003916 [Vibrio vulnificus]|uniref:hypothetical protein n=1 Tax=Vibrio parahaemolyticus TaxID=670 RepID=UPI001301ACE3|nr:hypothetical protein [Vibrio parahaemolyticus]EKF6650569.1 hypothetical protein [Vibrio parahaemolyticus]ELS3451115.1 hypothetical protein [Vibrio vulnificus]ELS9097776.1 hypothetical protein [Vibrio vulnificus]
MKIKFKDYLYTTKLLQKAAKGTFQTREEMYEKAKELGIEKDIFDECKKDILQTTNIFK